MSIIALKCNIISDTILVDNNLVRFKPTAPVIIFKHDDFPLSYGGDFIIELVIVIC